MPLPGGPHYRSNFSVRSAAASHARRPARFDLYTERVVLRAAGSWPSTTRVAPQSAKAAVIAEGGESVVTCPDCLTLREQRAIRAEKARVYVA
jgi:hypothetical protein